MIVRKITAPLHSIYVFLLFGVWSVLLGSLIKNTYFDSTSNAKVISLESGIKNIPTDSEWMTITHHGIKLGYSVYSVANLGNRGYSITSTAHLNLSVAGVETKILMKNKVNVDTLFRLTSFDFHMKSDQYLVAARGKKTDRTLHMTIQHGTESTSTDIQVPDEIYTYLSIQPMVAWQGITEGEKIILPAFDPVTLEANQVEITHEGKEEITIGKTSYKLNKIRVLFKGVPSILWLDDNGLTFREETIMGLVMEKATPKEALKMEYDAGEIDLMDVYAIQVKPTIKDPSSLQELTLAIDGIDPQYLHKFNTDRQKIIQEDPIHLRLRPVSITQQEASLDTFLVSNVIIQCTHPKIVELTRELTKNDQTKLEKVNVLNDWVYNYLQKRPVVSLSSALEILDGKQGDCSEHSTLFTSLSRSMGVPTKIHIGLVYLQGRFLYHAWPVVYLDGQWIAVDPTLGQSVADATHITLLEGDFNNITELINLLGRVKISIIEQKYKKQQL